MSWPWPGGDIGGEAARPVREALERMARTPDEAALAQALRRILEGERDAERLAQGLDEAGRRVVALVLAALERRNPEVGDFSGGEPRG